MAGQGSYLKDRHWLQNSSRYLYFTSPIQYLMSAIATSQNSDQYDVIIVGAGPAGCACAMALRNSGLRVALIEKHQFPRDKVCGDAIPGRAIKFLHEIDPQFAVRLAAFTEKLPT